MPSEAELELYQQLVGEQLSGVMFSISDLLLDFNTPPKIHVHNPVTVQCNGAIFEEGDDQFRNKLCEQITKLVVSVAVEDEKAFLIVFEDGSEISISLEPEDYTGPEALLFQGRNNRWNVIRGD